MNAKSHYKKVIASLIFTLSICTHAHAQVEYVSDDASKTTGGIWTEVGATKVLPYNLSLGLDAGFRTNEWFDEASRFDIGLGLGWKPTKHWKFGLGYTFLMKHYPQDTAHKTEWKYRATGESENTDFAEFMGAPKYTDADGTTYTFRGYNDATRVTEAYWRPKHRINVDAAYTYKFFKLLRITLRERYQLTFVPTKDVDRTYSGNKYRDPNYEADGSVESYDEITPIAETAVKEKSSKTLHTLRSRLTFELDKKGWVITPYAYAELFNDLGYNFHIDKVRASAGVEYSISARHRVQLGYIFNHERDDDSNQDIHAISVGYKFKF